MNYRISKKTRGIKSLSSVYELESEERIKAFCWFDDRDIYYIAEKDEAIGVIDTKEIFHRYIECQMLKKPISMCRNKVSGNLIVLYGECGNGFLEIDINARWVGSVIGKNDHDKVDRYYKGISNCVDGDFEIIGDCDQNSRLETYFSHNLLNAVLFFKGTFFKDIYGRSTKAGYSTSSNVVESQFNNPCGVAISNGGVIVADSGNRCIRRLSRDGIEIIAGTPLKEGHEDGKVMESLLTFPRRLKESKDRFYFIDDDRIKLLLPNHKEVATMYKTDHKLIDFEIAGDDLTILEEIV